MNRTQIRLLQGTTLWVVPLVLTLLASGPATAQQGIGFEASGGYQWVTGAGTSEYGEVLDGGIDGEFVLVYTRGKLRYGIGSNWASFGMNEPFENESFSNIASHLGVAFFPVQWGRISPFAEVRLVYRKLRPEGDHLAEEEPPEEGENTSEIRVDGWSGALLLGADVRMTDRWWAKVAGYYSRINTDNADLGDINLGTFDAGNVVGLRVGLFWTP